MANNHPIQDDYARYLQQLALQQPTPGYLQQPAPGYPPQPAPGYPQQPAPAYPQQAGCAPPPPTYQQQAMGYQQPPYLGYQPTYQPQAPAYPPAQSVQYAPALPSWAPAPTMQYQLQAPANPPMPPQWPPQQPPAYNTAQPTVQQLQDQMDERMKMHVQQALKEQNQQLQRVPPVAESSYNVGSNTDLSPSPAPNADEQEPEPHWREPPPTVPALPGNPLMPAKDPSEELESLRAQVARLELAQRPVEQLTEAKEAGLTTTKASKEDTVDQESEQDLFQSVKEQDSCESVQTPSESVLPDPPIPRTTVFNHLAPPTKPEMVAQMDTFTTDSLQRCVDEVPPLIRGYHEIIKAFSYQPYLNRAELANRNSYQEAIGRYSLMAEFCQRELTRRKVGGPVPVWHNGQSNYGTGSMPLNREYDVFTTTDYPPQSDSAGPINSSIPLINEYRPTGYPPRPATKAQRQLGEITIAEYPFWCSRCCRFGHKATWCTTWTKMPFLWFYHYILELNLVADDWCHTCLTANRPEAARSHTTKNCQKLAPYDHPENWSFEALGLEAHELNQIRRPYPGRTPSVLPRCLIFKVGDPAWHPEQIFNQSDVRWDFAKFGFDRMLAGMINMKLGNKNASIPKLNNASQTVWKRLTGKPQAMTLGTRTKQATNQVVADIGWGSIAVENRAPCSCPEYVPNSRGWWSEAFLADTLRLLDPQELAYYERQKNFWAGTNNKYKTLQGHTQRVPHEKLMIRTRRATWDHIFFAICHKEQYALRLQAYQTLLEPVKYLDMEDPIKRVDYDAVTLPPAEEGDDDKSGDMSLAWPLQMDYDWISLPELED